MQKTTSSLKKITDLAQDYSPFSTQHWEEKKH
jgi:hypothetical protein